MSEANNLMAADLFGKSDPYAVVHWDGQELGRTQVVKNTLDPVWAGHENSKFSLPPSTSQNPELRLDLFDSDWISVAGQPDDFLGRVVISAYELIDLRRTTMRNARKSKDPHNHRTLKVDLPVDEKGEQTTPEAAATEKREDEEPVKNYDVRIFNMEVHGLPETEIASFIFGKQDPYIMCKLGSKEARSSVKDGAGSDATYPGEVLSLQLPEDLLMHKPLTFEVLNQNYPHRDVLIEASPASHRWNHHEECACRHVHKAHSQIISAKAWGERCLNVHYQGTACPSGDDGEGGGGSGN